MKKPTLVIYTMSYYARFIDGVVNRNFHVANTLEETGKFSRLIFVDFLPYNFRSLLRSMKYAHKVRSARPSHVVLTFPLPYYMKGAPLVLREVQNASKHATRRIAWSYNPFDTSFLDKTVFNDTIFDTVDDWRHHSAYAPYAARLNDNYRTIAKNADVVFTVSDYLTEMYKREYDRDDAHTIPNTSELPSSNKNNVLHKNNIVYLGTIEGRFDIELVEFLVHTNPTKHFTFIGPVWKEQQKRFFALTQAGNVTHVGEKRFAQETAALLPTFDAGIIPHRQTKFSQSNDPLKAYDYLCAGLPVVSTIPSSETSVRDYIYLADTPERFTAVLSCALDENSESRVAARKEVMRTLTWKKRVASMLSQLNL